MRLLNHRFQDISSLCAFIQQHELSAASGLIQLFSGITDLDALDPIIKLLDELEGFELIGASTSGEIADAEIRDGSVLLAFSLFRHTGVETFHISDISRESGRALGQDLQGSDARLVIAFGNTLAENPEPFIEAIADTAPELVIAGGNAGDNARFRSTFVIRSRQIHTQGVVVAVLSSDRLVVNVRQLLNWTPIGIEMEVTRSEGHVIHELDGKPVLDVHAYYLGREVIRNAPEGVMEFPLIAQAGAMSIARAAVGVTEDGGLIYAGEFKPGQRVRFGVADIDTILHSACDAATELAKGVPIEGVYIYSCTARRSFLKQSIAAEVGALASMGPTTGFFTYGEYFHAPGLNRLLNITTTLVTLSEDPAIRRAHAEPVAVTPPNASTLRSLTHLSNVTALELRQSMRFLEQYKEALDKTAIVSKADTKGRITYVNEQFKRISGYSAEEVIGKNHNIVRHPDMPASMFKELWNTITSKRVWTGIIKNRSKDGSAYYVQSTIMPILDDNGEIVEYMGVREDVTELLDNERLIAHQRTDKLTGLPSRSRLLEDLEHDRSRMLVLADIRNFKLINDYYGIATGDRLISEIATQLSQQLSGNGIKVYRHYGAGFAFLPPATMEKSEVESLLLTAGHRIQSQPLEADGELIDVELGFGMALGGDHRLALAEAALHKAKLEQVGDMIICFSDQDQSHANKLFWINEVKDAISEQRLISHYQPIVHALGDHPPRYETLLRMIDREGRTLPPVLFLDIIKHTKHYGAVTRCMVENALHTSASRGCTVSVNLSAEDIENPATRNFILEKLRERGGKGIIFEITESESLRDYTEVKTFVRAIRQYNARIAIDDFGSGYSNFSYLVEIQPEFIKIDGSIISNILTGNKSLLVTESIVDLAHKIGAEVIAEFVSSDEIAECLRGMGVDYLQGFAVGKPAPLE